MNEVLQSADGIAAAAAASSGGSAGQHAYGQQLQQQGYRQQQQAVPWGVGLRSSPPQAGALATGAGVSKILGKQVQSLFGVLVWHRRPGCVHLLLGSDTCFCCHRSPHHSGDKVSPPAPN